MFLCSGTDISALSVIHPFLEVRVVFFGMVKGLVLGCRIIAGVCRQVCVLDSNVSRGNVAAVKGEIIDGSFLFDFVCKRFGVFVVPVMRVDRECAVGIEHSHTAGILGGGWVIIFRGFLDETGVFIFEIQPRR
jgi:hypothetical protein